MMTPPLLQVALGGALGASARYLTNVTATRVMGGHCYPWGGTLVVNVLGSFLMGGVLVVALAKKGGAMPMRPS